MACLTIDWICPTMVTVATLAVSIIKEASG